MQACLHSPHAGGPGGASRVTADDPGGRKNPAAPEEHNICQTHPRNPPEDQPSVSTRLRRIIHQRRPRVHPLSATVTSSSAADLWPWGWPTPVTPCRLKPSVKITANTPSINTSRLPLNRALRRSSSSRCVQKLKITACSVKQTPIVILNAHIRCFKRQNNQYKGFYLQPKWDWTAGRISCSYPYATWMLTSPRSASWSHFPAD